VGRGATFGDNDSDGDVDIFVVNNHAPPTLLRNEGGNRNGWLHIELVGTDGNRNAIGAKIQLKTADRTQIREVYAGESYMSSNSFVVEFGVGNATMIETLQVTWLNGETQVLHNISRNQQVRVKQEPRE